MDYLNRTASGPPVAWQSRIRPSGQKVWATQGYAMSPSSVFESYWKLYEKVTCAGIEQGAFHWCVSKLQ